MKKVTVSIQDGVGNHAAAYIDRAYWQADRSSPPDGRFEQEDAEVVAAAFSWLRDYLHIEDLPVRRCFPSPRRTQLMYWNERSMWDASPPLPDPPKAVRPKPSSTWALFLDFLRRSLNQKRTPTRLETHHPQRAVQIEVEPMRYEKPKTPERVMWTKNPETQERVEEL